MDEIIEVTKGQVRQADNAVDKVIVRAYASMFVVQGEGSGRVLAVVAVALALVTGLALASRNLPLATRFSRVILCLGAAGGRLLLLAVPATAVQAGTAGAA